MISATARCREPSLREAMRTLAPASTKPWAMAWPIPPAPPTATTFLPFAAPGTTLEGSAGSARKLRLNSCTGPGKPRV